MPHFIFIQQISVLNILNMLYNLHFFSLQDAVYFITLHIFGSCITHILNTGVLKFEEKKSVAKRLMLKGITDIQQCGISCEVDTAGTGGRY
jgi:hypothetical protein